MDRVRQMKLWPGMTVGQLVKEMGGSGVLGAGRVSSAVDVVTEMLSEDQYTVFLSLAGPVVPGGLRRVIAELIRDNMVDALVTSGAGLVHDIIESLGEKHLRGSAQADDDNLRSHGIGRVGDIYVVDESFEALEKKLYEIFNSIPKEERGSIPVHKLLYRIGSCLNDPESILFQASTRQVPVFCPGILDSMIGLHIWVYSQLNTLKPDFLADMNALSDLVHSSKKTGAIILGGGLPKHFTLGANILREGVDAAVQITMDRPEGGSMSGASLEEAISWKKARAKDKLITVIGDATIIFPLIVAASLERVKGKG